MSFATCALLALFAADPGEARDAPDDAPLEAPAPGPSEPAEAPGPPSAPLPADSEDLIIIGPEVEPTPSAATIWARWTSHLALAVEPAEATDPAALFVADIGEAALLRLGSTLALGLDWTAGDGFELAFEARLRHRLAARHDGQVGGEFVPAVRRALVRWQPRCGPALTLGMDVVRWGRTLARPFDVASPLDWRDGPLPPEGGERVPSFGVSLRQPLGEGEALVLWTPFYAAAEGPGGAQVKAPTQDLVHSSELALRLTQRWGIVDVGLGWMLRFDRPPALPVSATPTGPPPRQHVLGLELALGTGPLRWAAEAALFLDQRRFAGADLAQLVTGPIVRWALDVAIEPAVFFELTLGLEGAHAPGAATHTAYEGPDDLWLRARAALLLAWDGVLRLDVDARTGLLRDDWWVTPALTLRASSAVNLGLGLSFFGGNPLDLGLGALYDRADQLWLRATWTF